MRKQFEFDKSYVTWFANSKSEIWQREVQVTVGIDNAL